jgi:hypothetical protein
MIWNEKVVNYKILDLFGLYNFDIKFVLIQHNLKILAASTNAFL